MYIYSPVVTAPNQLQSLNALYVYLQQGCIRYTLSLALYAPEIRDDLFTE